MIKIAPVDQETDEYPCAVITTRAILLSIEIPRLKKMALNLEGSERAQEDDRMGRGHCQRMGSIEINPKRSRIKKNMMVHAYILNGTEVAKPREDL